MTGTEKLSPLAVQSLFSALVEARNQVTLAMKQVEALREIDPAAVPCEDTIIAIAEHLAAESRAVFPVMVALRDYFDGVDQQ